MRIIKREVTVPQNGRLDLHHLTDIHLGSDGFAERELVERVKLIEDDPCAYWTFGGDLGDLISHRDKRYTQDQVPPRYRGVDLRYATLEHGQELLEPIASKLLGAVEGNHEDTFDKNHGSKCLVEWLTNMGVSAKYLGGYGWIRLQVRIGGRKRLVSQTIRLSHGHLGGRSYGAWHNWAEKEWAYCKDTHIILCGHNHKPAKQQFRATGPNKQGTRTWRETHTAINGGSWDWTYVDHASVNPDTPLTEIRSDNWATKKGFHPAPYVGGPVLRLTFNSGTDEDPVKRTGHRQPDVMHTVIDGDDVQAICVAS